MPPIKPGPQPVESPVHGEAATPWSDRRRSPRYTLTAPAEITELRSKAIIGGRCTDMSAGGCYIDTLNPFPKGTAVRVRIAQGPRTFLSEAIVAFGREGMGMGLAFTAMSPSENRKLTEWLRELSCQSPAATAPPAATESGPQEESSTAVRNVLNQLISQLMRKRLLSDQEGTELLRELFR